MKKYEVAIIKDLKLIAKVRNTKGVEGIIQVNTTTRDCEVDILVTSADENRLSSEAIQDMEKNKLYMRMAVCDMQVVNVKLIENILGYEHDMLKTLWGSVFTF